MDYGLFNIEKVVIDWEILLLYNYSNLFSRQTKHIEFKKQNYKYSYMSYYLSYIMI